MTSRRTGGHRDRTIAALEIVDRYGSRRQTSTRRTGRLYGEMMSRVIRDLPDGSYEAEDFLDDDGSRMSPCESPSA